MDEFNHIYKSILTEGRVPSIFRKATPEELAERRVRYGKMQLDKWMEEFLKRKDIKKNKDGSWDVDGDVDFYGMKVITRLPVRFGKITGRFFSCSDCKDLTTLEGAPTTVTGGWFSCGNCTGLTTLEGAPAAVTGGGFLCYNCTSLTTLEGAPTTITGGYFYCDGCKGLTTLEGAPTTITGGGFDCSDCGREFTKDEVLEHCDVEGRINV